MQKLYTDCLANENIEKAIKKGDTKRYNRAKLIYQKKTENIES